jgi:site-specific DNA recombinase
VSAATKPIGLRLGIYIRVSTEEQAANPEGSIKNQEERLRAVVKLKNMEKAFGQIKAVYVETKSGKDTNRSELQKLLLAIRKREIDLVMVTELSRISRSVKDFSEIWDLMRANNCGFFSLRENFDTTTAAGEMVLLIVATLAQFERRQISERVAANFNIRALRGLFNGGSIPVGYRRIPERTGYLEIDPEQAEVVKMAFKTFLTEGALLATAKWLNGQGYKLKREREGGGLRTRLGIFTIDNLQAMLRNKSYMGIKVFTNKGKSEQVEAVWPAIIDRDTFERVNQILDKNKRANKNTMERRYPFLLAGLVSCKVCGDRLVGKSAHGRREKIPYYEHAWATRKGSCVPGLKHKCQPYRVLAKRIEPLVWERVIECLTADSFANDLLGAANKEHRYNPAAKEMEGHRHKVNSIESQLSLMAERLVSLPASVSPSPIYSQMEKLEKMKAESERALSEISSKRVMIDPPAELKDFQIFLSTLRSWLKKSDNPNVRALIARTLIKKIVVSDVSVDVHFFIGETYVQIFMGEVDKRKKKSVGMTEMVADSGAEDKKKDGGFSDIPKKIPTRQVGCSNTLTVGRGDWIRTGDLLHPKKLQIPEFTRINEFVIPNRRIFRRLRDLHPVRLGGLYD